MMENSIRSESYENGLEKGREIGMEEGSKERNIQIVKSVLKKDMNVNLISEITTLSVSEIERLKGDLED